MTEDHADYVLAKLSVVFPNKTLSVEEVKFWIEKLTPYELEDGVEAVGMIADSSKFWPSWAEFREYLNVCRRSHDTPELPPPVWNALTIEETRKRIAEARAMINP